MTIGLEEPFVEAERGVLFTTSSSFPPSLNCIEEGVPERRSLPVRRLEGGGDGEEYKKHLGTIIVFRECESHQALRQERIPYLKGGREPIWLQKAAGSRSGGGVGLASVFQE